MADSESPMERGGSGEPSELALRRGAVAFFETTTPAELTSWFLVSFSTGDYGPVHLLGRDPAYSQISQIITHTSLRAQEIAKAAVVRAIAEWRRQAHTLPALTAMCFVASDLRATDCIVLIRNLVDLGGLSDPARTGSKPSDVEKAFRALIGIVVSFAPQRTAEEALEVLFASPRVSMRYAAQLFFGLCRCHPHGIGRYFERFLNAIDSMPEFFVRSAIAHELVRLVPPSVLINQLSACTPATRDSCMRLLTTGPKPALSFELLNDALLVDQELSLETSSSAIQTLTYAMSSRLLKEQGGISAMLTALSQQTVPQRGRDLYH